MGRRAAGRIAEDILKYMEMKDPSAGAQRNRFNEIFDKVVASLGREVADAMD